MAWPTVDTVACWAQLDLDDGDRTVMLNVIDAVIEHVAHAYDVDEDDPPLDVRQAVTMQSARIYKRRETPTGLAGFGEGFVARVTKLDPDVARLLEPYEIWSLA